MTPYYRTPDDAITVYHARWEDVVAAGLVDVNNVALIHGDPPYGQSERTRRKTNQRGVIRGTSSLASQPRARDFPAVVGDDAPFDPAPLLSLERPMVLWGGQRYANLLPPSASWLWWGKRVGTPPDDNGDGELAWTNLGGPPREFQHLWRGTCRASEVGVPHIHPTQKPIALSVYVFQRAKLKRGDLVFVPYLGSGPDLPAANAIGLRVIACDVEEWCCRTAVARLGAVPHPEPTTALGPLFGGLVCPYPPETP